MSRYDALNLLTTSPSPRPASPRSDSGFSDLPSDSEEHFYFDEGERAEIGRRKKRRAMEEGREARIRAMEAERGVLEEEKEVGVSAAAVRVLCVPLLLLGITKAHGDELVPSVVLSASAKV